MKLLAPQLTFAVSVSPVFRVTGCAEKTAQESRGFFGFHNFHTCQNCKVLADGFQVWGSNGHCQATLATMANVKHWVKIKALERWQSAGGQSIGYRFTLGAPIYYKA